MELMSLVQQGSLSTYLRWRPQCLDDDVSVVPLGTRFNLVPAQGDLLPSSSLLPDSKRE